MDYRLFALPIVIGLFSWSLWRAFTRGELPPRVGGIRKTEAPIKFWVVVSVYGLAVAVWAAAGVLGIYRVFHPRPLAERIASYYPVAAVRQKVGGHAVLNCAVTSGYGVKDCHVVSESPPAMGFGPAALQISKLVTLPDRDRVGVHPGQVINLPIRFKLPVRKS
ncbi:hypothetical protein [Phenylobacterium sp.]|uniref:hypothetical protein n=1 Tax=Phenylobacterium sp. TaxID=1871053 RepID=UPI0025FB7F55|nr:hypothetical protein [Phenylobacterium sp.]